MFKFLKDKLKEAVGKFTKRAEKEVISGPQPILKEDVGKIEHKITIKKNDKKPAEEKVSKKNKSCKAKKEATTIAEPVEEQKPKPEGFLKKVSDALGTIILTDKKYNELFWELELALLENNVAALVIEKIKSDLRASLVSRRVSRKELDNIVEKNLRNSIQGLFKIDGIDLIGDIKKKKPYIILFLGVNGSGKTTTIAKLVHMLQKKGFSCVVAACDTFRAAAIQQLEEHTLKLGVKLIKHDYGSDAAAVAFDAIEHAKSKNKDVVLIDTAGRLHSNINLMDELKKIIRVSKPDLKIFVGEAITGNDCINQAEQFNDNVGIDGIILAKADIDEKGGAAVSVSYVTKKPILYLGTGQGYDDLDKFSKEKIIANLGLGS
ncbi:signal recognition particle-docking protein FtsY [Candidatus Woesearchaeota archaeon]|nr:signal recognition particle-docking protein FtsY [Candidatus Woesearchaeota archaeon]